MRKKSILCVLSVSVKTVISSALKMFSKYEQKCFIKIQIAKGKNARQCHTALLEGCGREILPYCIVARWTYAFRRGGKIIINKHTAIIAVERSLQRLVQQDAVDVISRLPNVWRRILHFEGDFF